MYIHVFKKNDMYSCVHIKPRNCRLSVAMLKRLTSVLKLLWETDTVKSCQNHVTHFTAKKRTNQAAYSLFNVRRM